MSSAKILSLDELERKARELGREGKRVVMCHGTFDLMHTGHIRHLQKAKLEGDVLLVTVTGDAYVNKGPGRPVFREDLRVETLAALACVDFVAINHDATAVNAIARLKPNVYVKGSEYRAAMDDVTGNIEREKQAVEACGGEIFYTDEITFSSSSLLNEHFGVFSPETKDYLQAFRKSYGYKDVIGLVKGLTRLRVLVIGDAIIDQYHYINTLGQTGKGNTLAVKYDSEEQFAGGSIAVANHLAGFADNVTLVTGLGKLETHEEFIRSKLLPNVAPVFFYIENAQTVTKRRFVDPDLAKLFEVYFFNEEPLLDGVDGAVCSWLEAHLPDYDVVIVPDFGNGFISAGMVAKLCQHARFLAVNTQINSGNRGHHVITRYSRANFASVNEPELRLAAHNRHDPLELVAETIGQKTQSDHIAVTRGSNGVMFKDRKRDVLHHVPALSTKVVDRIGAGDAFLAIASLCLGGGLPSEVAAFVGSVAAALDVQIVGNRDSVGSVTLFKYITTLLK
ncbi:MAG: PfkB family carbohydrate kinase [Burkholderiales bacterium]